MGDFYGKVCMMDEQGRRNRWPPVIGSMRTRTELLQALEAYRRGIAEAPVVCKWLAQPTAMTRGDATLVSPGGFGAEFRNGEPEPSEAGGALTFVASTGEVDRHGDTVALDGWKLDAYRQNPVVLWAHDYRQPAIGLTEAVWNNGSALLARMHFAPTGFAKEVEGLYRQGYQRGVSVGFRPVRFEERRDLRSGEFLGIQFLEHELLEISAVPVPANSQALLKVGQREVSSQEPEDGAAAAAVMSLLRQWRGAVLAAQ